MKPESEVILNQFKPRDYQMDFARAFEEQGYKKLLLVWPRRCLSGESRIIMHDGSYKLLKDIRVGDKILSWNGNNVECDEVVDFWDAGIKDAVGIKSSKQPYLVSSEDHKFAYVSNAQDQIVKWDKIKNRTARTFLMTYAGFDNNGEDNPDLAEFLGYMHSDGYVSGYQQPKFTNTNMELLKRVERLAIDLFGVKVIWRPKGNGYDLGFSNGTSGGARKNPVKQFFRNDAKDVPKRERRVHSRVWSFNNASLLAFLAGVISGDGCISSAQTGFVSKDRNRKIPPGVEVTINCGSNKDYAEDIYWICRRLGMLPQILQLDKGSNWKVRISRSQDVKLLLSVPIVGKRERQQEVLQKIEHNTFKKQLFKGCYRFSFTSESVEQVHMYDLRTKNNHNFFANGFLVHNSGKDFTIFNMIVRAALVRVGSYFYCLPTAQQARLVLWESLTIDGKKFLDFIPEELIVRTNSQQMTIELINGSIIRLIGSDNYDRSLVGTNPICVVFSEYALCDDRAYKFVRPIMNANKGTVIIASTPRGYNHFYDLFQIAKNAPKEWFCQKLTVDQTGHIDINDIKRDIANGEISEELAQQEYWVSFEMGIEGSYYGKYIDKMRLENRITEVPWEPSYPVYVSMDLGMNDSTVLIFFQKIGAVIHIIDYYENSSQGLEHYVRHMKDKEYVYGEIIAPHDIKVRELTTGMSRLEKCRELGLDMLVAPNLKVLDGIEAVRTVLPRCWIDEKKCKRLIKALENYRKEFDNKRKVYLDRPCHDQWSHACDAWRYACVTLPQLGGGLTAEEIATMKQKALYGDQKDLPYPFNSNYRYR